MIKTKVLQWNTGKSLTLETSSLLHRTLSSTSTAIALLQEPGHLHLPSNWVIHKSSQAAIVTLNTIQTSPLPEFTTITTQFSSMAIRAKLPGSNMVLGIISVYRKCGGAKGIFLDWLEDVVAQLPLHVDGYILGGDFNIHSCKWGSTHDDPGAHRLHALEESLGSEGRFLNTGSPTRGPWPGQLSFVRDTVIDLTLGFSNSGSGTLFNWRTGEQAGSDHFQIWLDIYTPPTIQPQIDVLHKCRGSPRS